MEMQTGHIENTGRDFEGLNKQIAIYNQLVEQGNYDDAQTLFESAIHGIIDLDLFE